MLEYTSERRCFIVARKGQKFQKIDDSVKKEIIEKYIKGYSSRYLSREYEVSHNTIQTWGKKVKCPEKYLGQGQKRGRPKEKELTKDDDKQRYEILKKYQAFLKAQRERK